MNWHVIFKLPSGPHCVLAIVATSSRYFTRESGCKGRRVTSLIETNQPPLTQSIDPCCFQFPFYRLSTGSYCCVPRKRTLVIIGAGVLPVMLTRPRPGPQRPRPRQYLDKAKPTCRKAVKHLIRINTMLLPLAFLFCCIRFSTKSYM